MGANSEIAWTDHTFNPWIGCSKVSEGCAHCYAETLMDKRYGRVKWGKGNPRQRTSTANWKEPIRWNKGAVVCLECGHWHPHVRWFSLQPNTAHCNKCGDLREMVARRPRVFCASLADWLDDEVPIEWLADFLNLIADTPNLDWLLLTKRPELCFDRINAATRCANYKADGRLWTLAGLVPHNVWLGVSTENQKTADERIPYLLKIPARIRFLSVEPMLGPIEFSNVTSRSDAVLQLGKKALDGIHWVIFGGESGKAARPCDIQWLRDGNQQCKAAGVKVFNKQLGAHPYQSPERDGATGYHLQLKDKKGGDITEWPEDLRVREFPA
jgi:protein gp37